MAEYSKKTVADLTEILKSRGLPTSGKKADLIARLAEADKAAETTGKLSYDNWGLAHTCAGYTLLRTASNAIDHADSAHRDRRACARS